MNISDSIGLNDKNFIFFAAKQYDNVFCDTEEFKKDLKIFAYIKRLFNVYRTKNELKERLILNHLVTVFNVWPSAAIPMLFFKLKNHQELLKTFLVFMKRLPDPKYDILNSIEIDKYVMERLMKEYQRNVKEVSYNR